MDIDARTLDLVTLAAEERLRAEGQKVPAEQSATQSSTMAVPTPSLQGARSITNRWRKRSSSDEWVSSMVAGEDAAATTSSASLLAAPSVPPSVSFSMPAAEDVVGGGLEAGDEVGCVGACARSPSRPTPRPPPA